MLGSGTEPCGQWSSSQPWLVDVGTQPWQLANSFILTHLGGLIKIKASQPPINSNYNRCGAVIDRRVFFGHVMSQVVFNFRLVHRIVSQ